MNPALTEAFVIASAGMLSFGQITLTLLLLSSEGGQTKALAYAAGMGSVLLAIGEAGLLLGARTGVSADGGSGATAWLSLVLGGLLLALALRAWRKPPPEAGGRPRFMDRLDAASPARLLGFGALVGGMNIKNLAIYLSAVEVLVRAQMPWSSGAVAILGVTVVFCSCILGPIALHAVGGAWSRSALAGLRRFLEEHSRRLAIGAMTLFGSAFLARGLHLLTS